jgi:hypothetical protein
MENGMTAGLENAVEIVGCHAEGYRLSDTWPNLSGR